MKREELAGDAPRALSEDELRRLLRAVERCASARDRAVALLLWDVGRMTAVGLSVPASRGCATARLNRGSFLEVGGVFSRRRQPDVAPYPSVIRSLVSRGGTVIDQAGDVHEEWLDYSALLR